MDTAQSTLNNENNKVEKAPRYEVEHDLVTWHAPARPFKKRDKQYFVTIFAMAGIVSLVIFLAEGLMPVVLIIALVFLYYILSTVPPENIEYKVTTKGIKIAGKTIFWNDLFRFCFTNRHDQDILVLDTLLLPGRIEIVVKKEIVDELKREISVYIPYEEIPLGNMDKFTEWLGARLPGSKQ